MFDLPPVDGTGSDRMRPALHRLPSRAVMTFGPKHSAAAVDTQVGHVLDSADPVDQCADALFGEAASQGVIKTHGRAHVGQHALLHRIDCATVTPRGQQRETALRGPGRHPCRTTHQAQR